MYFDTDMISEIIEKDIIEQIIEISKGKYLNYVTYKKDIESYNAVVNKINNSIIGNRFKNNFYFRKFLFTEKTFCLIIALSKKDEARKEGVK